MIENGFGGMTNPLQVIPGANNPWLMCSGSSGSAGGSGASIAKPGYKPPVFPEVDGAGITGPKFDSGLYMAGGAFTVGGLALVGIGSVALGAAAIGITPVAGLAVIGVATVGAGLIITIAGVAAMLVAIDPPVIDYAVRVSPVPRRRIAMPQGTPPAMAAVMDAVVEIEVLATGQIDIINRLRAAAGTRDKKSYEMHLRDLWTVQNNMNYQKGALITAVREFQKRQKPMLDQLVLPPLMPVRDMFSPITDIRPELSAIGISPAEQNMVLGMTVLPSPSLSTCEGLLAHHYRKCKTATDLVGSMIKELQSIDFISWDAFGGRPA